ncbi:MAG TPA: hypothetical protein VMZ53_32020, partial [Kofleriaceae bacterium]|nr:hypothetical protein [Kofleriaceae bacterium]
ISALFTKLALDERAAGIIYFDAADWGAPASALAPAIADAPVADRGLDGVFAPYFWDVPYADAAFAEIQALRERGITTGCATAPPRFCPDEPLRAADAAALVAAAFPTAQPSFSEPMTELDLANALVALGASPPPAAPVALTRRRAAVLIAHALLD